MSVFKNNPLHNLSVGVNSNESWRMRGGELTVTRGNLIILLSAYRLMLFRETERQRDRGPDWCSAVRASQSKS